MDEGLARRVYEACHLVGTFRLRSGQISDAYFDKYLFEAQPGLLLDVATAMVGLLPACDALAGMEMGGIPLVTVMSQLTGLPSVFVRKQAKAYGTCKVAEGVPVHGLRVVAIEDVVTTGGAVVEGCRQLRDAGALVDTAVCAIERGEEGAANLRAEGVRLRRVLSRADLDRFEAGPGGAGRDEVAPGGAGPDERGQDRPGWADVSAPGTRDR